MDKSNISMKANELQIGNLIYRPCCVDKVVEIRENGIIGTDKLRGIIPFSEIEPIQITEEWLEKNGFERFYCDICEFTYFTKEIDEHFVDVKFECSNTSEDNVICHVDNCDRMSVASADIRYIHQMQNLLNLMGIKNDFIV